MKKLVAFTGAGISAESGITTFRDSGGMWEQHDVMEVASIDGWRKNQQLMLRFYNDRRKQLAEVEPNDAHRILATLETNFDVTIVTQNVDNLHERAGSSKIIHLHGELTKARSSTNPNMITDIGYRPIEWGEKAADGSQLRPHIVWFGEEVPMMQEAVNIAAQADIFVVIGSSLNVYPAAGLLNFVPSKASLWLIDPNDVIQSANRNITVIKENASKGVKALAERLLYKIE